MATNRRSRLERLAGLESRCNGQPVAAGPTVADLPEPAQTAVLAFLAAGPDTSESRLAWLAVRAYAAYQGELATPALLQHVATLEEPLL
jgi:hypothetical protein